MKTARLLIIDNYDSFTYNLVQMFMIYDLDIHVHRCDQIDLCGAESLHPDYILISPEPKTPSHTGVSRQMIETFYSKLPILGVCLGMQCINEIFGGRTVRASLPVHGKTSPITHYNTGLFKGIPSPFQAARYHSLVVSPENGELIVTASGPDGIVMGLSHPRFPLHGVQFHPESFLTRHGDMIVNNFLKLGPLKNIIDTGECVK